MPIPPNGPGKPWRTGPTPGSSSTSRKKTSRNTPVTDGDEFQFGHQDLEEFFNEKAERVAPEVRPVAGPASSSCPTGGAGRSAAGSITSSPWRSIRRAGPISTGPRSFASVQAHARELYAQKEAELPARIALMKYLGDRSQNQTPRYDREGLAAWASEPLSHRPSTPKSSAPCSAPRSRQR